MATLANTQTNMHPPAPKFCKPVCYIDKPHKPLQCLEEIFLLFTLQEISNEIKLWQQLALGHHRHMYDDACSRENLVVFCTRLMALCEAFYLVYTAAYRAEKQQLTLKTNLKLNTATAMHNSLQRLSSREIKTPYIVIKRFCKTFTVDYARTELIDLTDAAVTYNGTQPFYKGNVLLLYRCLQSLLTIARGFNATRLL